MRRVLILPGAFQAVKNYGSYSGLDIWLKSFSEKEIPAADYYIGDSTGVNFILAHYDSVRDKDSRFIFVNPLIRKRNLAILFWDWLRFLFGEGIERKKIMPVSNWFHDLKELRELLKIDVWQAMQKIPKENLIVIRGKNDNYFCDQKSAAIIKNSGLKLIEVAAGHTWNKNIARAVEDCLKNFGSSRLFKQAT